MKKLNAVLAVLLVLIVIFSAAGCGQKNDNSLTGTWEYSDKDTGIGAVYVFKDDGAGTYTMKVGEEEVTYEMKYEVKDGLLLVRYVNNETFSEDDVFESEFSVKDSKTIVIKDSFGEEMTFVRK